MSHPSFHDPKHWRQRAAEARQLAEMMTDDVSKQMMLGIAQDYDNLATRAEVRRQAKEA